MKNLSRRNFLNLVGAAGGSSAIYNTSLAMGLLQETSPITKLELKNVTRKKPSIAILGAGISGLTIAYELERVGYECTIIEASHRIGGRNLTIRHGDKIDEMGYNQVCHFDDDPDMYFNAGPSRVPGHHHHTMHYFKILNIPLQVKANVNRTAYTHDTNQFEGKPMRIGEYIADARGFMSELLWKAVDKNVFDQPLSEEDKEKMLEFTKIYGDLDKNGDYKGTRRAGYASGGNISPGILKKPKNLSALLDSKFWRGGLSGSELHDWAEPLFEAVGGMDNLVKGFINNLKTPIVLNSQVQSIQLKNNSVDVIYNRKGKRKKLNVDYCFNSIPAHFMAGIPNNFSKEYKKALLSLQKGNFFKLGLQMSERFWEKDFIYGGITHTNQRINQIWYPSYGIHSKKGVLLGAYAFFGQSKFFERMTPEERIQYAADCGDKVHPNYSSYIEAGVSIPWGRMKHLMGCGSTMTPEDRNQYFAQLQAPEGRHYMVGDQISYHSSWQEGAFASAEYAMMDLDKRIRSEMTQKEKAS